MEGILAHVEYDTIGGADGGAAVVTRAARRDPQVIREALDGLTTTVDECAEDIEHKAGTPCASKKITTTVVKFAEAVADGTSGMVTDETSGAGTGIGAGTGKAAKTAAKPSAALLPSADTETAKAVRIAAAALNCDSESCVISHPKFVEFATEELGAPARPIIQAELDRRYKASGPRNNTGLLSNYNIDETLQRWARVFPEFFPCDYAMMDFDRTQEPFAALDMGDVLLGRVPTKLGKSLAPVRRPAQCFGCVVNTDVSTGPGKHWVAVFVDCRGRDWTVEYFNSTGNAPPRAMVTWMERTRARLESVRAQEGRWGAGPVEAIPVTQVNHQDSNTECGLYALYYIRRRLEDTPYAFFVDHLIPDAAMVEFRKHCFRGN